ncbi:dual specificity mitogen-activated protein kinase kinase 7-like [Schistocerca piceifrons]|uniref:dual specificity mitogen-activated protein kinase kinase 7-like n=1 Tax=Schistocerca piceifrons TaxID=274613 RepID=UPI001F5ED83C|nr:dual specificity mitogen-activated protein kinase kinase 7-like [Schistocerca piceifrons]XP_049781085.1 dual specificity mitogen-activated protein kinase kinase 7-like [Schistocerca cancellata]XP_049804791.1 dual specificity mitogen-activated protein kinase kinase 7-like isoform X1 [Schistocerca nitens]XP_049955000.1 dual specificity mitogen-activated protein kinase kinase 7-like [Schistocerca serialis cubense]
MSNTPLENRILDLQARLKAENEARNRDKMPADLGNVTESPRQGSGRRPRALGEVTAPARPRGKLDLPVGYMAQQRNQNQEIDNKLKEIMKMNGILNINGKRYETDLKDLEHLGELGNGTYGHVVKMLHKPSQTVIAVKQMRRSGNSEENKRIIMDLDVVLKSHDCPFIVQCLGCYITESDVWIYMELMATCFDKLLKRLHEAIPEDILGKVTCATVKALHYLKETHGVIHRDVKPSNILLDEKGNVKLCDFGISGRLVDSKAKTRSAGCAAYMAPERIDPPDPTKPDYDIRADVWSLGITLVELATGTFPYRDCKNDFEVLSKVLQDEPPSLPVDKAFSEEFREFVKSCLTKNYKNRPKYKKLLEHPFLKKYEVAQVNVAAWFALAMQQCSSNSPVRRFTPPPPSPSARRHPPLHHAHHRSLSETVKQPNGSTVHRLSDANSRLGCDTTDNGAQGFWKTPSDTEWDENRVVGSGFLGSPVPGRKRFPSEPPQQQYCSPSPLALQRFYQQHMPLQNHHHQVNSYPTMQPALAPHQLNMEAADDSSKLDDSNGSSGVVKKRFASYLKFHLGGSESRRNLPPPRLSRNISPSPGAASVRQYSPARQSPEPPPRLSRISANSLDGGAAGSSPLTVRRGLLDVSPVRRSFAEGSPSLCRRYISPSPPQPPPRRLSESTSVPGSPQHRRVEHFRARFQYTPEPQRRVLEDL